MPVLGIRLALAVLRAEAVRGAAEGGAAGDSTDLLEAIRRADLLLVHLADPEALARRLSRVEPGSSNYLSALYEICLLRHQQWKEVRRHGFDEAIVNLRP